MMKSTVFFADLREAPGKNLPEKVDLLLEHAGLKQKVREKDLVAIKLHFGEKGNTTFVRPIFLRRVVERVKACKGKPFLTDTNTLYRGERQEAVSHLAIACQHGFSPEGVGAPVIIADGIRGNSSTKVRIDKPLFKTVSIAHEISMADVLVGVSHFKGHELTGFAGTLKNLGMGCASREGKLSQHSNISPQVKQKACKGCERCLGCCPEQAISMISPGPEIERKHRIASVDAAKCIGCAECLLTCPSGAIIIRWNETVSSFQKKMIEHACGAVQGKNGKTLFLNFLLSVTPSCDCLSYSEVAIVPDIGILCSEDPVAIDQASVDLVNQEEGIRSSKLPGSREPGRDKFRALYPEADWSIQLDYGEAIGLGKRDYELIRI
jgi:uncharacterized protein